MLKERQIISTSAIPITGTSSKDFWLKAEPKQTISDQAYGTLTSHLHLFQSGQRHKHIDTDDDHELQLQGAKGHRSEAY